MLVESTAETALVIVNAAGIANGAKNLVARLCDRAFAGSAVIAVSMIESSGDANIGENIIGVMIRCLNRFNRVVSLLFLVLQSQLIDSTLRQLRPLAARHRR